MNSTRRNWRGMIAGALALVVAVTAFYKRHELESLAAQWASPGTPKEVTSPHKPLVELVGTDSKTLQFTRPGATQTLDIRVAAVQPAPPPEPLKLPGTLTLDPNRLIHVHSRFDGEVVAIGTIGEGDQRRTLQYGDHVQKGQLLATIWSKEMGEKKSELIDALSRQEVSQSLFKRLESVQKGVVTERMLLEARRATEADMITVAKVERTLRSWRMTDAEIETVRREYHNLQQRNLQGDNALDREWAQVEVHAAISGTIVEKNFNVGDMVDPSDNLFKIADLSRMQVVVNVYEEDLFSLRNLKPDQRLWSIDLKSDPVDNRIQGRFELIGSIIDPAQRTGVVMGWLDNEGSTLLVGQFVTATVQLPSDPHVVAVPETALIEDGDDSSVFVETNAEQRQFSRRQVHVVRRCAGIVHISSSPKSVGVEPLQIGERVVTHGALSLSGELANLKAANPIRS